MSGPLGRDVHDGAAWRLLVGALLANTDLVLPMILLGAVAVLVREELRFGEAALGVAAAVFALSATVTSAPGGRLSERVGAARTMTAGAVISGVALPLIGLRVGWRWAFAASAALALLVGLLVPRARAPMSDRGDAPPIALSTVRTTRAAAAAGDHGRGGARVDVGQRGRRLLRRVVGRCERVTGGGRMVAGGPAARRAWWRGPCGAGWLIVGRAVTSCSSDG